MNKKCTICEGVYDRQKIQTRNTSKPIRIIIKNSGITLRSENPDRCITCLDFEKYIKDECFLCKVEYKNNESDFIKYGNLCYGCRRKFNEEKTKI
jgi:hypothetical protein